MKKKDRKKRRKRITREQKKRAREYKIAKVKGIFVLLHPNSEPEWTEPPSRDIGLMRQDSYQIKFPEHYPGILLHDLISEKMKEEMRIGGINGIKKCKTYR